MKPHERPATAHQHRHIAALAKELRLTAAELRHTLARAFNVQRASAEIGVLEWRKRTIARHNSRGAGPHGSGPSQQRGAR